MSGEYDKLREVLDDAIYSWAKLQTELNKFTDLENTYYPLKGSPEEFLHMLISWRSSLD